MWAPTNGSLSLRSVDEVRPAAMVAVYRTMLATAGAVSIGMVGRALLMQPLTSECGPGAEHCR